jgi:hypothetical protein
MKTVIMFERFDYSPRRHFTVRFEAGVVYLRVLEAAARQIESAGAGRIIAPPGPSAAGTLIVDARHAFRRRR